MSVYYVGSLAYDSEYLAHHGIKGQKWGIRRFQNEDGSLTELGMQRYKSSRKIQKDLNRLDREIAYNKGDAMKLANKASRLERKVNRYQKRHPDDDKGRMAKYTQRMKEFRENLDSIGAENAAYKKRQEGLQWAALGRGMDVSTKSITRSSVRSGELIAKETLAVAGAIGMAYFAGFGITSYSTTPPVKGTKYKVKKSA